MDQNGAGALLFGGGFFVIIILLSLIPFIIWVWALVDAIRNPRLNDNERLLWVIVILLTHCLGALIYVIAGRKK
jgi:hypothetical protein